MLVSWASLSMTTVARPLSAGTIVRLVSLRSSLRALDSAEGRLGPTDLALLRIPMTWVLALSVVSCGAPALLRAASVQFNYLCCGYLLGGRAKLRPLARTDVWGCVSTLEDRLTTHWSEGVGWDLFLLSSSASNLHLCLSLAVSVSKWLWLRWNCSRTWKCSGCRVNSQRTLQWH